MFNAAGSKGARRAKPECASSGIKWEVIAD